MIQTCPFCAAKVRPADQDCPVCKQRMIRRCPSCAESIAANATACKYCGDDAKAAAAGIEFIEDTKAPVPAKKKRCRGKAVTLLLLLGLFAGAVAIRTDCVPCTAVVAHQACISTGKSVSHCERRVCRNGKTPLWVTVVEKLGGHVKSCPRKVNRKAPSPDTSAPRKDDGWD